MLGSYPGATYVPGATASDPDTLTWSLRSVSASATGSLTYKVTVDAGTPAGSLVNLAAMTANNVFGSVVATAKTAINIAGVIDLVASKALQSGSASYVGDGDSIAYDLSITNNGNAMASNVLLVDPLPKGHNAGYESFARLEFGGQQSGVVVTGYSGAVKLGDVSAGADG